MTGHEIVNEAEVYVGYPIESDMALVAINEAMRVIADLGLVYDTISLDSVCAREWKALPSNFTHVLRVYDINGDIYDDWEEIGGKIRFGDSGSYSVQFRKLPKRMADLLETPDINEGFLNSIVRFVREFAMQAKAEDFRYKNHDFTAFKEEVMKTHGYLTRRRRPKQVKVIRHA